MASKVVNIIPSQPVTTDATAGQSASASNFTFHEIKDPVLRAEIQYHVEKIRQSIRRTAWEVVEIGRSLAILKDRLGWGRWEAICLNECGIDPRVARRMMGTAEFANERLKEHEGALENLSTMVVYRLAQGNLADAVIEEVIQQAAHGTKVTPGALQSVIDRLEREVDANDTRNEHLETDNAALRKDVERELGQRKDAELLVLKLKEQINRHDEALERASSERISLLDERQKLKQEIEHLKANPAVVEKEVAKLPPEYASVQDAVKAKEKRLREVSDELQEAEVRIGEVKRQIVELEGQRASAKASLEVLACLEAEVQALTAKYTAVYVASAAASDSKLAAKLQRVASLLHKLADHMERAAVRTPTKRR